MKRKDLKELIGSLRPSLIKADMISDPLLRRMKVIREKSDERFRDDLRALYSNRMLKDEQIGAGYAKALSRRDMALKKLRPLEERFEREVYIPMLKATGVLRDDASLAVGRPRH